MQRQSNPGSSSSSRGGYGEYMRNPRSSSPGNGHGHHPCWPPASSKVAKPRLQEDFSSCDLVLLGSVWVTPKGPARRSTAGTHSPEGDEPTGLDLSPRPPRRPWVTISQHEPIFLGRLHGTQWHRCHYYYYYYYCCCYYYYYHYYYYYYYLLLWLSLMHISEPTRPY